MISFALMTYDFLIITLRLSEDLQKRVTTTISNKIGVIIQRIEIHSRNIITSYF